MKPDRIRAKADAFRVAWGRQFGRDPTDKELVLGLAVALGETRAGDAWPGPDGALDTKDDEHNWGATNLRKLNEAERIIIAAKGRELLTASDVTPREMFTDLDRLEFTDVPQRFQWVFHEVTEPTSPNYMKRHTTPVLPKEAVALAPLTPTVAKGHEKRAQAIHQLLAAELPDCPAGDPPDGRRGAIHCDSHPGLGPFFVWFAAFDDDTDGAAYFIRILSRTATERAALASGSESLLARAMYAAGYYGGFHVKDKDYVQPDGSSVKGSELNIRDYTKVIARQTPSVRSALAG